MIKNTNDGSQNLPYLRVDFNYNGCNNLPSPSNGPRGTAQEKHEAIKMGGFGGIQDGDPSICKKLDLGLSAHARINQVGEFDKLVPKWKEENYECATLHLGWGMESDTELDQLVGYVLETSVKNDFPLYIETHRATITQDMQRTVELVKRFPEIRFNGDFSHWYTGQEMVYGGFENKLAFIQPVLERVRYIHGRIGNPGCIQVEVRDEQSSFVDHFKQMWTSSFQGFLKSANPGDYICFTVELLPADIYYALAFADIAGNEIEEGDRWQQAILYQRIANDCWKTAVQSLR